jgi:protein-S-isoprenylcysteine O-methyltransferase Ste14
MAGWLQNLLVSPPKGKRTPSVPAQVRQSVHLPAQPMKAAYQQPQGLPNATVIYGIVASLLFVSSFFLVMGGRWFPGIVVFSLGVCLTGFALHLLKHQD